LTVFSRPSVTIICNAPSRRSQSKGLREGRIIAKQWDARFNERLDYKTEHGDCDVPNRQGKLGHWVSAQRSAYMADSLAQSPSIGSAALASSGHLRRPGQSCHGRLDSKSSATTRQSMATATCRGARDRLEGGSPTKQIYKKGKLARDCISCLNGVGFDWTPSSGDCRKRNHLPSQRGADYGF